MRINQLKDINYNGEKITLEGSIIELVKDGNPEKKLPTAFKIKLEGSGENVIAITWQTEHVLPIIRDAIPTLDLFAFEAIASVYKDKEQIKVLAVNRIPGQSNRKVIGGNFDEGSAKSEIAALIRTYVRSQSIRIILEDLVLKNEKFFKTPGGTKVHHSYPGGLAAHSLSVAKKSMELWESAREADAEVLLAGSLLHDLGKIEEYKPNGERTLHGDLFGHIYMGAKRFDKKVQELETQSTPEEKTKFKIIEHIILSHHGKLEFGSPVLPSVIEAVIVHRSDETDAVIDSVTKCLRNMEPGEQSEKLLTTGSRQFKWRG